MASTALTKAKEQIASKSRALARVSGERHIRAGMDGAVSLAGAAGGAALDNYLPDMAGLKPSVAAAIVSATAGFAMKQPKLIQLAIGPLSVLVYNSVDDALSDTKE